MLGSAAAWVIGFWGMLDGQMQYEPLMAQGTFFDPCISVFTAEAIALDEAVREVDRLLKQCDKWLLSLSFICVWQQPKLCFLGLGTIEVSTRR